MVRKKISIYEIILSLPKTIYFNLKYFPYKDALKLPIFISHRVSFNRIGGEISINELKRGLVFIGFTNIESISKSKSSTIWDVTGKVFFEGHANMGIGTKLIVSGDLIIGKNFNVAGNTEIWCTKKIIIGQNNLFSWDVLIMDTDHHIINDNEGNIINSSKSIEFGDNVWIGTRCTILKGTKIGNNCVIGANSLANKIFEGDNNLIGGNPASVLKYNIHWKH